MATAKPKFTLSRFPAIPFNRLVLFQANVRRVTGHTLPFAPEATDAGEQTLVPGVRPVTLKDRLEPRMAAPTAQALSRPRSAVSNSMAVKPVMMRGRSRS